MSYTATFRGELRGLRLATQGRLADVCPALTNPWMRADLQFMLERHAIEVARRERDRHDLTNFASATWSQNGEDGMLAELFRRVGVTRGRFVEIGAADGTENCTRALAEAGWAGVWIEADARACADARQNAPGGVVVVEARVSPTNVSRLLRAAGGRRLDLLVLDIDSQDWRVLRAVLRHHRPIAMVVEYNAAFPPGHWWIASRGQQSWDHTHRHGASLDALTCLAHRNGYALVGCDPAGVNAFFVRRDFAPLVAPPSEHSVDEYYTAPWFSAHPLGHPRTGSGLASMPPLPVGELTGIHIERARREVPRAEITPGAPVPFSVVVTNGTAFPLSSGPPAPLNLSVRWYPEDRNPAATRVPLAFAVRPARSARVFAWHRAPNEPGVYRLRITAVQEGVAWIEDVGSKGWAELPVVVAAR